MAHFDLPLRARNDFAQLRSFALSRNPPSAFPPRFDDTYLPITRRRPDRLGATPGLPYIRRSSIGPASPYFDPLHDSPQQTYRPTPCPRREAHPSNNDSRTPFSKAARTLYFALHYAARKAEALEREFALDTQYMPYADGRARARLWTLKVSYRGWQDDGDADVPPPPDDDRNDHFALRAERLLSAIEGVRGAGHFSRDLWAVEGQRGGGGGGCGGCGGGGVGVEDVRLAMKKLGVGLIAIKELLEGFKVDKGRCAVLVRELRGAEEVLNGIRDVWDHKGSGERRAFGGAGTTARAKIPVAYEDEWGDYRGE